MDFLLSDCGFIKTMSSQSFPQVLILHLCLSDVTFTRVCHILEILLEHCSGLGCFLHLAAVVLMVSVNPRSHSRSHPGYFECSVSLSLMWGLFVSASFPSEPFLPISLMVDSLLPFL